MRAGVSRKISYCQKNSETFRGAETTNYTLSVVAEMVASIHVNVGLLILHMLFKFST